MKLQARLKELKVTIPELVKPVGSYVPAVKSGSWVVTSGQLPMQDGRLNYKGRVGQEVTLELAQKASKIAVVNALAAVQWAVGDLSKVKKIVRMNGFVCATVGFYDHAKVMNGASDLLLEIFGEEIGTHTRTSVGCLELPLGSCVEIDLTVQV